MAIKNAETAASDLEAELDGRSMHGTAHTMTSCLHSYCHLLLVPAKLFLQ